MLSRTSARQQRMRQQTLNEERSSHEHEMPRTCTERRSSGCNLIYSSPTPSSNLHCHPNPSSSDRNILGSQPSRTLGPSALLSSLNGSADQQHLSSPMESCFANIAEDQGSDSFDLNSITPSINLPDSEAVSSELLGCRHRAGDSGAKASTSCPAGMEQDSLLLKLTRQPGQNGTDLAAAGLMPGPTRTPDLAWMRDRTKKDSHNRIERKRRDYINSQITELGNLLPEEMFRDGECKKNKGSILKNSVELICLLRNELGQMRDVREEAELAAKLIPQLVKRVQELESLLSSLSPTTTLNKPDYQHLLQDWALMHERNTQPRVPPRLHHPLEETASPGLSSIATDDLLPVESKSVFSSPSVVVGSAPVPSYPPPSRPGPADWGLMRVRCTSLTAADEPPPPPPPPSAGSQLAWPSPQRTMLRHDVSSTELLSASLPVQVNSMLCGLQTRNDKQLSSRLYALNPDGVVLKSEPFSEQTHMDLCCPDPNRGFDPVLGSAVHSTDLYNRRLASVSQAYATSSSTMPVTGSPSAVCHEPDDLQFDDVSME